MHVDKFKHLIDSIAAAQQSEVDSSDGCIHFEVDEYRRVSCAYDKVFGRLILMTCFREIEPETYGDHLWGQLLLRNATGKDRLALTEDYEAVMYVRALSTEANSTQELLELVAEFSRSAETVISDLQRYANDPPASTNLDELTV